MFRTWRSLMAMIWMKIASEKLDSSCELKKRED
jgi:hypothetical protein